MMNSFQVINEIVSQNLEIKTLRFFSFSTATKLQDRLSNESLEDFKLLIAKAIELKKVNKARFWSALFEIFIEEKRYDAQLLSEALYHQPNKSFQYVERREFETFSSSSFSVPMAINSKVITTDGLYRHIPLLDFKVHSKSGHDSLVLESLKALGLEGYLLDSGKSYHFIGNSLISESELLDLLSKFVLLDPISDKAWAAHQLIERSASLRLTAKDGSMPLLISRV